MRNYIDYICLAFLQHVFFNVSSVGCHTMMHSHTGCICMAFLHCVLEHDQSSPFSQRMRNHNRDCTCLAFVRCLSLYASSNCLPGMMQNHIDDICLVSLHYVLLNVSASHLHWRLNSYIACI